MLLGTNMIKSKVIILLININFCTNAQAYDTESKDIIRYDTSIETPFDRISYGTDFDDEV